MDNKLINIPNDDKQNYPFCKLTLFVEKIETNTPKFKATKVLSLLPGYYVYKTLGTSIIFKSNVPSLLGYLGKNW